MSRKPPDFVSLYRAGLCTDFKIDDYIEAWHAGVDDGVPLHEYLGMTYEQYKLWVEGVPLKDIIPYSTKTI